MTPQADVRAVDVTFGSDGAKFDVVVTDRAQQESRVIPRFRLPMFGLHNVQNALAAILVGIEMGVDDAVLRAGLASFKGVKRRFTKTGESGGITVIDDYGHHPVEIAAVLRAARQATTGNVIAVVQPHRFSRVAHLFEDFCRCFNDADAVLVADIYAAGEAPIAGIDRDSLVAGLVSHGHRHAEAMKDPAHLPDIVSRLARPGDFVVCLGAGSITHWANALPQGLDRVRAAGGS